MKSVTALAFFFVSWSIAACDDATAIVGHRRTMRDAAAGPASNVTDASFGDSGRGPRADDSATLMTVDAAASSTLTRRPALAPPIRHRDWSIEAGSRDEFCASRGGALRSAADCVPIERQLFAYALCTCENAQLMGDSVSIDGFDSSQAAYAPGQGGASVGINGALTATAGEIQLAGSLIVTGSDPVSIESASFVVQGDLQSGPALSVSGHGVRIGRDAWLSDDVRGPAASVEVARDVYLRPGVASSDALRGRVQTSDFVVSPPCACDPSALLDVPAIVAAARAIADNDAAGISEDVLRQRIDTATVALPCGRFVLSELSIPLGTVVLAVSGRSALFVEGNVDIVGTFAILLADGAELDLFVSGDLNVQGTGAFGANTQPRALRIYVGGTINAFPSLSVAAGLYAPRATLTNLTPDTFGALFVGSIATSGAAALHYDRALVASPAKCESAGRTCASCDECADGLACVGGRCGDCGQDSDCCAPFSCSEGRCQPLQ